MANLYIAEQNAVIRKTGDRLVVEKGDEVLREVSCSTLDTVLLFGNVQVTSQAAAEMLDHGVEIALLTRKGRLRGQLTPPNAKNVPLRMAQYRRTDDKAFALAVSQKIVEAKIANTAALLRRRRQHQPDEVEQKTLDQLDSLASLARSATSLDSLRGIEGTAAARHFAVLPRLVPESFAFTGRSRRPPRDPFNALLSFGYVLVGTELQALLDAVGFDPFLGLYHQMAYGRPSLALDLVEEFRAPFVDRVSLKLLNLEILKGDDFVSSPRTGVRLSQDGLDRFFATWEKELETPIALGEEDEDGGGQSSFRQLFRRQVERLAGAIRDDVPYQAFRYPC